MVKAIRASVLVLLLACSAQAGWIQNEKPAPPPQPATAIQEPTDGATVDGEIPTPPGVSERLTQIALELLAVLPSLF